VSILLHALKFYRETMTKNKAIAEILLCSALWSIAGILMKQIPWSGFVIAGFRSLIAGVVMACYMAVRRLKLTVNARSIRGGLALCATMTLFSVANKTTTAANAIVLQFTSPIWILLLSAAFLKKRFRRADLLAVAFTFLGIVLFFLDGLRAGNTAGNLVALGSGLTFGLYYMSLGDCPEAERMSAVLIAHFLTFLIGIPAAIATRPVVTAPALICLLALGVFQLGIPYVLLAHASGWCPPLICALLGALEPLLNPVWVAIFDGELPGVPALIGGLIVIAAVTALCIYDAREEARA
jgi:drug/metabolite transporter (DMT)-like permease